MELGATTLGLALLAGLLTTLSPCVLPILPMVASSASGRSRWGLITLALGLATSFTLIGVVVTTSGQVLVVPLLQRGLERISGRLGNAGGNAMARIQSDHPAAQFAVGGLLGVAWSPCVGPTLGAAIALAAQGQSLAEVAVVMAVFSLAAVVPLVLIGAASRSLFNRHRDKLISAGQWGRKLMGWSLLLIGAMVLTGFDKVLEAWLLGITPQWLIDLTTRF